MKPYLPLITFILIFQDSPAQEAVEQVRLREQFVSAANRAVAPITQKYIQQLELLKANYLKQGKNQESDHVKNEIIMINQATEAGMVKVTAGDLVSTADSVAGTGKDLKDLQGTWINSESSNSSESQTFEFKQRKMSHVYRCKGQGGGMCEQTRNYTVKQTGDKIMITLDQVGNQEYRKWYEINAPFSLDNLEMTSLSVDPNSSSKNILQLKRKR